MQAFHVNEAISIDNNYYLYCIQITIADVQNQVASFAVDQYNQTSKATGQEYELFISLPSNYNGKDSIRYPVLYILDGNFTFPVMENMQRLLNETEEVSNMILVGIGYHTNSILGSTVYRTPDYTPTRDTAFEQMLLNEMKMKVKAGGADKFLQAMKQDIIPSLEKKYKTTDRGLAGHSFGALFGTYVLFHEPALFNKYLLSSISLPWDNQVMLQQEQAFYQTGNRLINAHVFVTVGAQEEAFDMIPLMKKLAASIKEHN